MGHLNETLIQGLSGGVGSHTLKPISEKLPFYNKTITHIDMI